MAAKKPTKEELTKQLKQLKEEVRELRETSSEPPARAEGVAEGIVAHLGKMIPGLQKLVDAASEVPEFRQRLASIDDEIKRKFKEQPLRQASREMARGLGDRPMGIPPGVRRGRSGRPGSAKTGRVWSSGKPPARDKHGKPGPPEVRISPETPAQLPVDVFDEGDKLVILAEATGLKSRYITVSLEDTVLVISIDGPHGKGVQRVELPCKVAGEPMVSFAKGVLKIQVSKADKQ